MADYLIDTNILARWIQPSSPQRPLVQQALRTLTNRGDILHITGQNLLELWSVATRPTTRGGLALTNNQANIKMQRMEQFFRFLPEHRRSFRRGVN